MRFSSKKNLKENVKFNSFFFFFWKVEQNFSSIEGESGINGDIFKKVEEGTE